MDQPCHIATRRGRGRGVTLIELMVGLVLGLVVTLVVSQVMAFAESQKRITTGGSDAQVNGALALYTLQREIQMAGYGLAAYPAALGCPVHARHSSGTTYQWTLAPITITDGASGAPDTLNLLSANRGYSVPMLTSVEHLQAGDRFTVRSMIGAAVGDLMIAAPALYDATNWCSLFNASSLSGDNLIVHATGVLGPWNQDAADTVFPASGYAAGSIVVNAGQLINRSFALTAGYTLRQTTVNTTTAAAENQDLFPHIVNLQALYGKDTNADGVVDTYDNDTPTTNTGWRQVLTIRLAVVARSASHDKDEVTTAEPLWDVGTAATVTGSATCGTSQCITLKIASLADWKHYRYQVFEVIVPLRNMLWNGA